MNNTLSTVIQTVDKKIVENIDLIDKIDSFYNNAWNKLVIIGTVSLAIIGVIVPILIQWYQKKTLSTSEQLLKKEIENYSIKIKSELLEETSIALNKQIKEYEKKIEKIEASLRASTFHLQANSLCQSGNIIGGMSDFIYAAFEYIKCEDYRNLSTVLEYMNNNLIPELSQQEINDIRISKNQDLYELIKKVYSFDKNHVFDSVLGEIKLKLSKIPETKIIK